MISGASVASARNARSRCFGSLGRSGCVAWLGTFGSRERMENGFASGGPSATPFLAARIRAGPPSRHGGGVAPVASRHHQDEPSCRRRDNPDRVCYSPRMRRILVTGANKGIGRAIARAILEEHTDTFVYLASRDAGRGREAAEAIGQGRDRVEVVELDVVSDASVHAAVDHVRTHLGNERLYGLVNNAGLGHGTGATFADMIATNTLGLRRVTEAFLPLIEPEGGRIVNVTSAAGPSFLAGQNDETKRLLTDPAVAWPALAKYLDTAQITDGGAAYGLSKAVANAYTLLVAREHPKLLVNACTPGFIATDMTRGFTEGKSREELEKMGMKAPEAGAVSAMFLLFGELEGNGRYYGSDGLRSPLDRYRAPGSEAFDGRQLFWPD
jgi:NAD(P)-dependent dehydrogenase (short-subunit alcohol dehydrogenase family)